MIGLIIALLVWVAVMAIVFKVSKQTKKYKSYSVLTLI